jgi:hypothetical protein
MTQHRNITLGQILPILPHRNNLLYIRLPVRRCSPETRPRGIEVDIQVRRFDVRIAEAGHGESPEVDGHADEL